MLRSSSITPGTESAPARSTTARSAASWVEKRPLIGFLLGVGELLSDASELPLRRPYIRRDFARDGQGEQCHQSIGLDLEHPLHQSSRLQGR